MEVAESMLLGGGVPKLDGWFLLRENHTNQWMRTRGTPNDTEETPMTCPDITILRVNETQRMRNSLRN